jgi:hypothetical protein
MKKLLIIALLVVLLGACGALAASQAQAAAACMCRPQSGCKYNHPDAVHGTWGQIVQGLSDEQVRKNYQIATSYGFDSTGAGYDGQTGWYCMKP